MVTEEGSKPLGDCEHHLAVGDVFEQFLLGPVRPQKLTLLVAAGSQAPELAREGDEELVPAIRTAHSGHALVEDAAIEVAVNGWFDATTQIAVGGAETVGIYTEGALKVMGESPVENCTLGTARAIDAGTRCGCNRLHSPEKDGIGSPQLA